MLAQRTENASIDALDIDTDACRQARINVEHAPFNTQINVFHTSLLTYNTDARYDLIVSNPPFFSNALKSPDSTRNRARHDDELPLIALIKKALLLLSPKGRIALILPISLREELALFVAWHPF